MTRLRDAYNFAVDAGNDFKWRDAVSFVKSKLSGADSLYLSVGSITILRDDNTTLLEWILFHKSLVKQCVEKRIMNPNELWVRLMLGQVSPGEKAKITMPMPQTETEREAFDLAALEVEIKASKKKFPTFKQSQVREFTKTLPSFGNTAPQSDAKTKYCDTCKKKHAPGKHTAEGRALYKKQQAGKTLRPKGTPPKSRDRRDRGKGNESRKNTGKCFVCDKVHTPFCKLKRGQCAVCKKEHQPYCKRPGKSDADSSHPVIDAQEVKGKLKNMSKRDKRRLATALVENFDELFAIESADEGVDSAETTEISGPERPVLANLEKVEPPACSIPAGVEPKPGHFNGRVLIHYDSKSGESTGDDLFGVLTEHLLCPHSVFNKNVTGNDICDEKQWNWDYETDISSDESVSQSYAIESDRKGDCSESSGDADMPGLISGSSSDSSMDTDDLLCSETLSTDEDMPGLISMVLNDAENEIPELIPELISGTSGESSSENEEEGYHSNWSDPPTQQSDPSEYYADDEEDGNDNDECTFHRDLHAWLGCSVDVEINEILQACIDNEDIVDGYETVDDGSSVASVDESFPIGLSNVCRARMQILNAEGKFETIVVSPDSMSSVTLAEANTLHFCTPASRSKLVKGVGGTVKLDTSGLLVIPHPAQGSVFIPAYAAPSTMIPTGSSVLLSKEAVAALQVD